jgi:DNA-binding MarR family transcriptional regulator
MSGQLRQQLRQQKPFERLEAEVFLNVVRTAAVFLDTLADVLRPHDLSQPQYNVLRILRGAGPDGLPSGAIGERMVRRDPDVTRLVDRLEARGLVARNRPAGDRRVVRVGLTSEGRRLVDALDEPVADMHRRQLGHLTPDDLRTLSDLLEAARRENSPDAAPPAAQPAAPPRPRAGRATRASP